MWSRSRPGIQIVGIEKVGRTSGKLEITELRLTGDTPGLGWVGARSGVTRSKRESRASCCAQCGCGCRQSGAVNAAPTKRPVTLARRAKGLWR